MMTSPLTHAVQPWMRKRPLTAVFKALEGVKPNADVPQALLVGGCVRDALLGEPVNDIDIATVHAPETVMKRLKKADIKVIPTGLKHGTVTAIVGKQTFEITTLRCDMATDGRHAEVAFTDDWMMDAARRDFTMNALYMDLKGHVFDPTGQGIKDLKARVVRFVGDPDKRIAEDYLRILRFFRFYARFGQGAPDEDALLACDRAKGGIATLSCERITQEFEKLLLTKNAGDTLDLMLSVQVLDDVIQANFNKRLYKILQHFVIQNLDEVTKNILFSYTVYENKVEILESKIDKYLSLSKAKKSFLIKILEFISDHCDSIDKNIYKFGKDVTSSGMILYILFNEKSPTLGAFKAMLEDVRARVLPRFPIKAEDVMRVTNLKQGKKLGDVLKSVERWWLDQDMQPDKKACVAFVKTLA